MPGDLEHHDVILPFVGTSGGVVGVELGDPAGVGVTVTPAAQSTGLYPCSAGPRAEGLQPRTYSVQLNSNREA